MTDIKDCVQQVTTQIKADPELYYAYQANIAMAFVDEMGRESEKGMTHNRERTHKIANQAAKNFLDLWCKDSKLERKKNIWGADIEDADAFCKSITKNAGPRDV